MRELRAILIGVSPLLADLIRRAAGARLERAGLALVIVAEIGETADPIPRLEELSPDLIILGGASGPSSLCVFGQLPTLTLSTDLARIFGPGEGDSAPLTPRNLAARMVELATSKGPLLF